MHTFRSGLLILFVTFLPPLALAQADCSKEIAAIEERIESGTYPEQNVQLARQLQASLRQMCAFIDDESKAKFVEQIDEFLPMVVDEKLREERSEPSDAQEAARDSRNREKAEARAKAKAEVVLSPVLQAAPTARYAGGQFVDRPEQMASLWVMDWDTFGGKLRILYLTMPNRLQAAQPDWTNNLYVVEVSPDGTVTQHQVTSKQENFYQSGLALRRGHDEVLFNRRIGNYGKKGTLERWSISGKRQLSSVPAPSPVLPGGKTFDWGPFRVATSDGNVLFSNVSAGNRGKLAEVAWFEASPDGKVLGQGSVSDTRHIYRMPAWFPTNNGGGGMVLDLSNGNEDGVDSAVATPIRYEIGCRQIFAFVSREKRLLVTNDSANSTWESAAIERDMMWGGELAIPNDLPPQESMNQSNDYMQLTRRVALENGSGHRVADSPDSALMREMIMPMKNGYGVLSRLVVDTRLNPPRHGFYFLKVDSAGVHEHAYLEPYADQLNAKFTHLGISGNDDVYLYGFPQGRNNDSYVIRLGADGKPGAYGSIPNGRKVTMQGLLGDSSGAWVIGKKHMDVEPFKARLWVGRVEFP